MEKEHFSYIRTHTPFFGSDFSICVVQKRGTFEDQDLITIEVKKKQTALINDWGNSNTYGKNPSKTRSGLIFGNSILSS